MSHQDDRRELVEQHRKFLLLGDPKKEAFGERLFLNRISFSVSESAHLIGISYRAVCKLIQSGEIRAIRPGSRKYIIPRDEIEKWLSKRS